MYNVYLSILEFHLIILFILNKCIPLRSCIALYNALPCIFPNSFCKSSLVNLDNDSPESGTFDENSLKSEVANHS